MGPIAGLAPARECRRAGPCRSDQQQVRVSPHHGAVGPVPAGPLPGDLGGCGVHSRLPGPRRTTANPRPEPPPPAAAPSASRAASSLAPPSTRSRGVAGRSGVHRGSGTPSAEPPVSVPGRTGERTEPYAGSGAWVWAEACAWALAGAGTAAWAAGAMTRWAPSAAAASLRMERGLSRPTRRAAAGRPARCRRPIHGRGPGQQPPGRHGEGQQRHDPRGDPVHLRRAHHKRAPRKQAPLERAPRERNLRKRGLWASKQQLPEREAGGQEGNHRGRNGGDAGGGPCRPSRAAAGGGVGAGSHNNAPFRGFDVIWWHLMRIGCPCLQLGLRVSTGV